MATVKLTLNGETKDVQADEGTPLLYVLRDGLLLNGPRYGCGQEQCGACRVLVDGKPAYACAMPIEALEGTRVTTVEGLGTHDSLHPLQQAFLELNAAQCGYCASGIIISAAALLDANRNPGRAEIQEALKEHLCRCGAHNRIIKAVARAAEILRSGATTQLEKS